MLYYQSTIYGDKGGRLISPRREVKPMEVKDTLSLMLLFGMFILALLTYMKKK
ncbi:putative holin-like toxin [Paenibacillus sp. WLX2291]|uniref:putative holin-like toxin n=1 Tax=Paenibacillus sp. WLX2291 TaxID=3296934 RepID=UPI0039844C9B